MTKQDRSDLGDMTSDQVGDFATENNLPADVVWNLSREVPCTAPDYLLDRIHGALEKRRSTAE